VLKEQHFAETRALPLPGSQAHPWLPASVANWGVDSPPESWPEPPEAPAHDLAQETPDMSIEAHLAELERRHSGLEAEIAEARAHPSIDNLQIVELKRRKLLVKDEIARLQN
jgi:hypothetical protein